MKRATKNVLRSQPSHLQRRRRLASPAAEAEKRAAQVEILKRLSVLDQDEYDCLRKAYLSRL